MLIRAGQDMVHMPLTICMHKKLLIVSVGPRGKVLIR